MELLDRGSGPHGLTTGALDVGGVVGVGGPLGRIAQPLQFDLAVGLRLGQGLAQHGARDQLIGG